MLTTVLLAHSVAGRVDEIGTAESTIPIRQCFVVFAANRVTSGVISEKVLTISEPHFHWGLQEVGVNTGTFFRKNRLMPAAGGNVIHYTRLFYDFQPAR